MGVVGGDADHVDRPHPRGQQAAATVAGDRQQPRFHVPLGVPAVQVLQSPDKCLLSHIFGVLALSKAISKTGLDRRIGPSFLFPGAGSEMYRGLGSVVIGGLLVSTFLTLVVIPVVYSIMDRKRWAVSDALPAEQPAR